MVNLSPERLFLGILRKRRIPPTAFNGGVWSGFTLLELILVLIIMSILTASALPSLNDFKKQRDLSAAAGVASQAVNYARSVAVTTGRRTRLIPERGEFKLLVEENPLTEPGSFLERSWPVGLTGALPDGVRIEQVFYPITEDVSEDEGGEESAEGEPIPELQTIAEAEEERESVLLFDADGSTRDTFIYLATGDPDDPVRPIQEDEKDEVITVAVVGVIGTAVIVPRYTEEIFDIYERTEQSE